MAFPEQPTGPAGPNVTTGTASIIARLTKLNPKAVALSSPFPDSFCLIENEMDEIRIRVTQQEAFGEFRAITLTETC